MIAIDKLVWFILFLVVLAAVIIMLVGVGNPTAEKIILQNKLRQCCVAYRANNCQNPGTIFCDETTQLSDLMSKLNMQEYEVKRVCDCK